MLSTYNPSPVGTGWSRLSSTNLQMFYLVQFIFRQHLVAYELPTSSEFPSLLDSSILSEVTTKPTADFPIAK